MIPIPLVIALALIVLAGLCWIGHRRCRQDDADNVLREATAAGRPVDGEPAEPSEFTWGHSSDMEVPTR